MPEPRRGPHHACCAVREAAAAAVNWAPAAQFVTGRVVVLHACAYAYMQAGCSKLFRSQSNTGTGLRNTAALARCAQVGKQGKIGSGKQGAGQGAGCGEMKLTEGVEKQGLSSKYQLHHQKSNESMSRARQQQVQVDAGRAVGAGAGCRRRLAGAQAHNHGQRHRQVIGWRE